MENDFISVIVPVYNVKRYLEACVMSILGQSYRHFELILVDDGSTDGSAPLCDDLAQRDNRIIVVHQKNGGVSSARNHGLAIMKGKYCTFVDADDIVEADWLKQLHAQITTTGAQLACCSYSIINRDGQKEPTPCHTEAVMNRNDALFLCMQPDGYRGQLWNKIFRSDIIQRNDLQMNVQLSMMEDMDFLVRYMQHTERVSFSAYPPLYNYVIRGDSAVRTRPIIHMLDACRCIVPVVQASFDTRCEEHIRWLFYTCLVLQLQRTFHERTASERKALLKEISRERNYFLFHHKYSWLGYAKKIALEGMLRWKGNQPSK